MHAGTASRGGTIEATVHSPESTPASWCGQKPSSLGPVMHDSQRGRELETTVRDAVAGRIRGFTSRYGLGSSESMTLGYAQSSLGVAALACSSSNAHFKRVGLALRE